MQQFCDMYLCRSTKQSMRIKMGPDKERQNMQHREETWLIPRTSTANLTHVLTSVKLQSDFTHTEQFVYDRSSAM